MSWKTEGTTVCHEGTIRCSQSHTVSCTVCMFIKLMVIRKRWSFTQKPNHSHQISMTKCHGGYYKNYNLKFPGYNLTNCGCCWPVYPSDVIISSLAVGNTGRPPDRGLASDPPAAREGGSDVCVNRGTFPPTSANHYNPEGKIEFLCSALIISCLRMSLCVKSVIILFSCQ